MTIAAMTIFIYVSTSLGYIGSIMGGALAGTFGTITFFQSKVPSWRESLSNVRIGIGLDPSNGIEDYTGGHVPGVATWDEVGTGLGWSSGFAFPWIRSHNPPRIKSGGYRDIQLRHNERNNGVPTYLAVSASGPNSICISYLYITDISGKSRLWLGDVGAACGGPWHYSSQIVGTTSNYKPRCVWIRNLAPNLREPAINHGKNYPRAMGIHLSDFSGDLPGLIEQYIKEPRTMCGSRPRFSYYSDFEVGKDQLPVFRPALRYKADGADYDTSALFDDSRVYFPANHSGTPIEWPNPPNPFGDDPPRPVWFNPDKSPINKRTADNQTEEFDDAIIVTSFEEHQTKELCGSPTSAGPSLVNTKEGEFCDMTTKKRWPLCNDHTSCACLDLGSYSSPQGSPNWVTKNASSGPFGLPDDVADETFSTSSGFPNVTANITSDPALDLPGNVTSDSYSPPSYAPSGGANGNGTAPFLRTCNKYGARDTSGSKNVASRSFSNVIVWS